MNAGRASETLQRYTTAKEFFDCHGELHISLSKSNRSATIIYDHKCHAETPKFRITEEIQQYIKAQQLFPPRQIYQNLIQLADSPQFAKTDLHTITRQQIYNVWLSLTKREWERDRTDDFKSAQLLVGEHRLDQTKSPTQRAGTRWIGPVFKSGPWSSHLLISRMNWHENRTRESLTLIVLDGDHELRKLQYGKDIHNQHLA
ncbi:hypothetical protein V1515DRAFT_446855 [Lipomyces mesembrius]